MKNYFAYDEGVKKHELVKIPGQFVEHEKKKLYERHKYSNQEIKAEEKFHFIICAAMFFFCSSSHSLLYQIKDISQVPGFLPP